MMIVKNEIATLPTLFESVKPLISQWLIVDTGSTDGTQKLIQDSLAEIPGELQERPWVNFGHNRSELISQIPESCDFALLMDADQILKLDSQTALFEEINLQENVDAFLVKVLEDNIEYLMPYLVRRGAKFLYEGSTHEFLIAERSLVKKPLQSAYIIHVGNGGSKTDKFERDVRLLEQDIAEGRTSSRNYFYLGQSYESIGETAKARENYETAASLTRWDEERYLANLRSGRILKKEGDDNAAMLAFFAANEACPDRNEAIFEIVKIMESKKMYAAAHSLINGRNFEKKDRILFIEGWINQWGLTLEAGVVAWHVGHKREAKDLFEAVLTVPNLPAFAIELVNKNLAFC
jgi:tetratricopeptide (TPR) repeat protein